MAVMVAKLEGEDILHEKRQLGVTEVFRVTDHDGGFHYFTDDVEAAKAAVTLSEPRNADHR